MGHLKSYELFEKFKPTDVFWNDLDACAKQIIVDKNFYPFYEFAKKYPDIEKKRETFHDGYIVPLHNRNFVKKNVSYELKIIMYLNFLNGWGKSAIADSLKQYPDFRTWFETANLKIYRGVATFGAFDEKKIAQNMEVEKGRFGSFTLDFDTAVKFTQPGWAMRAWVDVKSRNGLVFEGNTKPCNVHLFNNESGENECVMAGPYRCATYHKIVEGVVAN